MITILVAILRRFPPLYALATRIYLRTRILLHLPRAIVAGFWHRFQIAISIAKAKGKPVVAIALIEHLGDIVACEPLSRYCRSRWPSAHIIWVVRPAYSSLVRLFAEVDSVYEVNCLTEWMILKRSAWFDHVIDLHFQHRRCPCCQCRLWKHRGNPNVTVDNYYHHGSLLSAYAAGVGIVPTSLQPQFMSSSEEIGVVAQLRLPANYIVIHTRSNEPCRDWHDQAWNELCRQILERTSLSIVEIGTEKPTCVFSSGRYRDLVGKLTIPELVEVIRRARLFTGIDSGPAHIASAVKTLGVVILGKYRQYESYMPYSGYYARGEGCIIVRAPAGEPAAAVPVNEVILAVEQLLDRDVSSHDSTHV